MAALTGVAAPAFAQTAAVPPAAPAPAAASTDVIVTAERREQNIQKVPVAVTAFTTKQRDLVGIESLEDMTAFAPGLVYSSQLDHLYVRGVGRQTTDLAAPAGVATFFDGFYNPDPILAVLPPLFVQDTEVLRGPQGTLGGRNGIAGALMVTAKRPTSTPYAEARLTVGNYGYTDVEGAVSGPIVEGLNFRIAGYDTHQTQGYFKDLAGGASEGGVINEYHVEAALDGKYDNAELYVRGAISGWHNGAGGPGSRVSNSTQPYSTFLNDDSSAYIFSQAAGYNPANILPGSLVQRNPSITGNPGVNNIRDFSGYARSHVELTDANSINAIFTYHFPTFDVKYTGGYQTYSYSTFGDFGQQETDIQSYVVPQTQNLGFGTNPSCAPSVNPFTSCLTVFPQTVLAYTQTDRWYSHELTLASTNNSPLQWIGGLYYYDENYSNPISVNAPGQPQVAAPCYLGAGTPSAGCPAAFGLGAAPANPSHGLAALNYYMESRSEAAYGQLDWKATDQIKLTGGVRYTADQVKGEEFLRAVLFGGSTEEALGLGTFANPALLGAATPAIDVTPLACAIDNAAPSHKGETTPCTVGANGVARRGLSGDSGAVTGTAGVEWTPDNETLVYARYSRGYKSLGFNAGYDLAGTTASEVAPESMNDYEAGVKKSWGRALVVNATLFYEDYANAQVPLGVETPLGVQTLLTSIPKSVSDGFELEAHWTPIKPLLLNLSYAFDNTQVLSSCNKVTLVSCYGDPTNPNPGLQNTKGNPLPNAPRNKVSLNGIYTFVFDQGSLVLSASYLWRDAQYGSIFNNPWWKAPSSSDVDLRATWEGPNDRYEIILYGRNIFNTLQYESGPTVAEAGNALTPTVYRQYILQNIDAPTTYGVELHYKFF
ncbi:MAG TPA: TonB-dependent receptor [Caulobacteraceae bacterium]|nr:TonB-dependent receptor [Caulobacteraceae bacterium]